MNKPTKKKIVKAIITEKTTADLYHWIYFGIYTGYYENSNLSFYGSQSRKLNKELNEFMSVKDKEYKASFETNKLKEIEELQKQLLITVDGWFKKPSKEIKKKIKEIQDKEWNGISGIRELLIYHEFLASLNIVKISQGENHTIYEILPN